MAQYRVDGIMSNVSHYEVPVFRRHCSGKLRAERRDVSILLDGNDAQVVRFHGLSTVGIVPQESSERAKRVPELANSDCCGVWAPQLVHAGHEVVILLDDYCSVQQSSTRERRHGIRVLHLFHVERNVIEAVLQKKLNISSG